MLDSPKCLGNISFRIHAECQTLNYAIYLFFIYFREKKMPKTNREESNKSLNPRQCGNFCCLLIISIFVILSKYMLLFDWSFLITGWSADLETWKSQAILWYLKNVREFREIWKSQGILARNWEKSGNFTCVKWISPKFYIRAN